MAARRFVSYLACAAAIMLGASGRHVQAQNWDGSGLVRFGVFLQGSMIDYDIKQLSAAGAQSNFKASPDGFGVGISAGYDLRLGSFIIGAEADVSLDDGGARSKPATGESYGIDYFSTLRGRFGYVVHPSLTVYGTAGYSLLGAEYKLNGFTSRVEPPVPATRGTARSAVSFTAAAPSTTWAGASASSSISTAT